MHAKLDLSILEYALPFLWDGTGKAGGREEFIQIYILSGIVAAIGQMMISADHLWASGAGVMGCLAIIAPEIRVLLFFVIPLSIRAVVVLFEFA